MATDRTLRLEDFESRSKEDPTTIVHDALLGSYIAVNPMADEADLLARLGISSLECRKVDLYWKREGDVYFLQVETQEYSKREPGVWARMSPGEPAYVNLLGVIESDVVTRGRVHTIMSAFASSGLQGLDLNETLMLIAGSQS